MIEITYITYTLLSSIIILRVGELCYRNGKVYILNYFPNNINFGNGINRLLRIAYYCLNIGLTIWTLHSLSEIYTVVDSITEICKRLSYILSIIGILHFMNLLGVYFLHKHYKNNNQ